MRCVSCQHRYRIDRAQVTRRSAAGSGSQTPGRGVSTTTAESSGSPWEGGSMSAGGLSGLSELMQRSGSAAAQTPPAVSARPTATGIVGERAAGEIPSAVAPSPARACALRRQAKRSSLRRKRRSLYLFVGSTILAVAGIGTLVFVMTSGFEDDPKRGTSPGSDSDRESSRLDAQVPVSEGPSDKIDPRVPGDDDLEPAAGLVPDALGSGRTTITAEPEVRSPVRERHRWLGMMTRRWFGTVR